MADHGAGELELLTASARLARELAPRLCEGCAAYHGFYPVLRRLGLAAAPDRHADFYADQLGRLARADLSRVLVTGSGDWGMLDFLLRAYREAGTPPRLEVVDICETPLHLGRWWAEQRGVALSTHAADVLDFAPGDRFDVVVTHSFVAKFEPAARGKLFEAWARLLRPGGRLVTTARIDPELSDASVSFAPGAAHGLRDEVSARGAELAASLDVGLDELASCAEAYAAGIRSYPVSSREEIEELCAAAGLELEELVLRERAGATRRAAGAGMHRTAVYAEFVARRC